MFGWLKTKEDPKVTEAFKKGQEFAGMMAEGLETFLQQRATLVSNKLLEMYQDQIQDSISVTEFPPLHVARAEYSIFIKEIDETFSPRMRQELLSQASEYLNIFDDPIFTQKFEEMIDLRLSQFKDQLVITAFKALTDYAEPLKEADDRWRAANPEKSLEFPPPP